MEQTHSYPRTTPKDFFLHLGSIVGLYVTAVSLLTLLFQLINTLFPDAASYNYGYSYTAGIRNAIAALIIAFPLYLYLMSLVNKEMRTRPETAELPIRKWLTYFTLFIAGVTVAIDLIVVINAFLAGELTARFLLKVLSVLVVTGIVFGYYTFDLRREKTANNPRVKQSAIGASVLVAAAIIGSFFVIGSPFAARLERLDDRRVSDLQNIQWQIINYWQQKEELPETLNELADPISGFTIPRDPETEEAYGYRKIDTLTFELCATFGTETPDDSIQKLMGTENWQHEEGRHCFTRPIDPELYPPRSKNIVPTVPRLMQ